jgi:hypothetical protein
LAYLFEAEKEKAMRRQRSEEEVQAFCRTRAKSVAGKTTKRAKMWKQIDYLNRRGDERKQVQRYYCTEFRLWRFCGLKQCQRARACEGDADACLKRSVWGVPPTERWQARLKLLEATPRHIGKAELEVRKTEPTEFWRRPVDPAVQEKIARAQEEREREKQFGIGVEQD